MRYNPIRIRFYHYDQQTSLRKLLWHEDDLDTNVSFNLIFFLQFISGSCHLDRASNDEIIVECQIFVNIYNLGHIKGIIRVH